MSERIDWKLVTRELVSFHQELGAGCVDMGGDPPDPVLGDLEQVTPDDEMYATEEELTAKKVRGWLWHHRKADWMPQGTGGDEVLFSAVVEDVNVVGIARLEAGDG